MTVKRNLWSSYVSLDGGPKFPKYPCPSCADGRLRLTEGSYVCHETDQSKRLHAEDGDWEPQWTEERFTAFLTCDEANCGEMVVVSGDTDVFPAQDDDWGHVLETVLRPLSLTPPPPIFPIPRALPVSVQRELRLAFQLYWADRGACVSRLRTTLEVVLNDKKNSTQGVTKKGKPYRLSLSERIDLFEQQFGDAENAESMHALRTIGNLGTHGDGPESEVLFDAMDVYEDALLEIYEGKTAKLKAKKLKLKGLA
jgi:hypothetical protein